MDVTTTLQAVINTLNQIPVFGAENLDRMLGCIQVLTSMKEDVEKVVKGEVSNP